jgi:ankyrin repeat protein
MQQRSYSGMATAIFNHSAIVRPLSANSCYLNIRILLWAQKNHAYRHSLMTLQWLLTALLLSTLCMIIHWQLSRLFLTFNSVVSH